MERLGDVLNRLKIPANTSAAGTGTSSSADAAPEPEAPVCPRCKGAGYLRYDVPVGHPDFGKLVPCECRQEEILQLRRERLARLSNLGPLVHHTFATLQRDGRSPDPARRAAFRAAVERAEAYAADPKGWLVLLGPPGCGKTHLAAAIANARIAAGHGALFVVVPDLLDHLRATYAPTSEVTYDELFDNVRDAELLVLDDFGTQSSTAWAEEKLFQLLNHRFHARLPTVITGAVRPEELDDRLQVRIRDPEISEVVVVQPWEDEITQRFGGLALERLREMTFATFDVRGMSVDPTHHSNLREAYRLARDFADQPRGWLILIGGTARGKTHLAAAIANERAARGQPAYFVTVPDLLDYLRSTFAPDSKVSYDRVFEAIRTAPLLILDDLGAQSSTPWAEEKLFQLLNFRYNARLPTVITSNLRIEDHDPRLRSRMLDPHLSIAFVIDVPPYRLDERPSPTAPPRRPKRG